ncbi:nitrate- and nitrite sensing domain-containing protein [Streptomyces sp. H27-C3]|uniref:nitrate- and nitrite sensing domain-containing protein n=1 Tax=Streptomyces sp. H27-C3 TaxID=3046305 RepID=UPI0024BB8553|nr:nitrate- and nitrite sensing domain-containing protein [Streptomyces sp. H27-C3]MDJ0465833.1 nitrate- and nitrite sensing domain-containing protein [Streptomyces sp. H27-C3]
MRFRGKSIRRKIVALLLVPLVSLTSLWGFATVITGREADQLLDVAYIVEQVGYPIEDTVRVIQQERRQTLIYLADPRASDALAALRRERAVTDASVAKIKERAAQPNVRDEMRSQTERRLASLLEAFEGIEALRSSVEDSTVTRRQALDRFNRLVDPCYAFLMTLHALEDVEMDKQGRALVGVAQAREMLSRQDALVASALVARQFTAPELREVAGLVANRKLLYTVNLENLPYDERDIFERYWRSPDTEPLRTAEERLIASGAGKEPKAVSAKGWNEAATGVLDHLADEAQAASDRYQDRVDPVAFGVLVQAGLAGVLGFLALLISLVLSVRIGRSLARDLSRLRKEAHEASGVRLPSVMRRLAAGEEVDVETEAPRLEYERDEVGQVGQALNTLQRAAVESAVKQADMRRGVSEVFVNLARRNQVLLHRQLTLLDTMERRTEDTDELADLFRLDHLTTRMRRHAEGLVILSGATASRQWRKPVQLMDVVRAAVAEVEDYERIEVRRLPRIGVGGPAVADLTHLIAELLENATVFSPPHTAVQVHGERVANGFTLEIHDRGLGMTPDALLDANLRLAETPEFELSDTDRLGLFVVSRLAQRQNVRVSLQPSPYGGTTAIVFIPAALLTDAPETNGTGFRLDRKHAADSPGTGDGARRQPVTTLARVPAELAAQAVLDGPVELEPPLGVLGLEEATLGGLADIEDIEDTESERGGIFRPRERPRDRGRDTLGEQHQQASEPFPESGERAHPGAAVPLPRRKTSSPVPSTAQHPPKPPTLVSDNGRLVGGRRRPPAERTDRTFSAPPAREPAATDEPPGLPPLDGLPRRVRQASLAPQLKDTDAAGRTGSATDAPVTEQDTERDADEVRSRMASLQRGWQRGRRENDEPEENGATGGPGGNGAAPGDTAPGTTPEGNGR